jgi:Ni2+-binding GTPase involved in maturation of urease and hydrogenase
MKYLAIFALLVLAVIVVVNADADSDDQDHCKAKPAADAKCGETKNSCHLCLAKECFQYALKNDCQGLNGCIANSACTSV